MDYKSSPHLIEVFDFDILHMELNTALYILVLVLVVMFFLNKLLFQPVLRTLDNRSRLKENLRGQETERLAAITRLAEEYEARLADVRAEVARVRAESHRATQAEVTAILEQAREAAQAEFRTALDDLQEQVTAAKRELGEASRRLAEQTTNRILQA
jgi:F-type H+-transporting ATPase subunit b